MDAVLKLEKIKMSGRQRTNGKFKIYNIGDFYTCADEVEHAYLLEHFGHHWKDATEKPAVLITSKKGAK